MIVSWKSRAAKAIFEGHIPGKGVPPDVIRLLRRKLAQLDSATCLDDVRNPPGNRLHALSGNRQGQWSIRVNDQFRICFIWGQNGPEQVDFLDYH